MGEFPAWDLTLECETLLPAALNAMLYRMAPGETARPALRRLRADGQVTVLQITGKGFDDTFVLREEVTGPITASDLAFEGRALLLRREPALRALAVDLTSLTVTGQTIQAET